ncbi:MAG: hypothetical protein K6G16_08375 [Lachnospiraceae bacterium]|nr:hypothetical protein [Lachnospiraceae bacterium]
MGAGNGTKRIMTVLAALLITLCGCGSGEWTGDSAEVTTLGIDKDGHVREVIVEDFSENYYSLDELRASMESDVKAFLAANGAANAESPAVVIDSIEQKGSTVRTVSTYRTAEDYGDFTLETLWYGSLRQAGLRGYELPSLLTDREGASYTAGADDKDNHVIFTDGHDHIVAPYRIKAVTKGVKLVSDTEADFSGTEGRAAILLEK